jgi:hypothetical protein
MEEGEETVPLNSKLASSDMQHGRVTKITKIHEYRLAHTCELRQINVSRVVEVRISPDLAHSISFEVADSMVNDGWFIPLTSMKMC